MMRNVVLAHDFSPSSERALSYGIDLAERAGATLHLTHVEEVPLGPLVRGAPSPLPDEEKFLNEFRERCQSALDAQNLSRDRIRYHVARSGSVAPSLVDIAEEAGADLIVMGTQGQRGVRGAFVGSVAREVLRTAPCPVLTTRALSDDEPPDPGGVDRIVVPIDFSNPSREALQYTGQLSSIYAVPVTLVHVVERPTFPSVYELESPKISSRKIQARAERTLQDWGRDLLTDFDDVSYVIHEGEPASVILETASSITDLLVMATRGRSGLRRTMLGSVTEEVISEARGPVLAGRMFPSVSA